MVASRGGERGPQRWRRRRNTSGGNRNSDPTGLLDPQCRQIKARGLVKRGEGVRGVNREVSLMLGLGLIPRGGAPRVWVPDFYGTFVKSIRLVTVLLSPIALVPRFPTNAPATAVIHR